jgi:hypothetical protein
MATNPFAQLLILYLTTPSSDFYLSKLVKNATNPTIEPFSTSNIDLGSQTILGVTMALSLQNVVIQGLSSVQVAIQGGQPEVTVNGNDVHFVAQTPNTQAPPPGIPSQLTLTGVLLVVPSGTPQFSGNLTVTNQATTVTGDFTATSQDGTAQTVNISFSSITLGAAATTSNMSIQLKMDNPLSSFINSLLNQPPILQKIVSAVEGEVSQASVLSALSAYATQAARSALGQQQS